jgi:tricorn protease
MRYLAAALVVLSAAVCLGQSDAPFLLRKPAISKTQIAFNYAGDLWIADRNGGDAHRLTAGIGRQTDPSFSPDGSQIAFTGEYAGNDDVYVVSTSGGQPLRLTSHPAPDSVLGWTPDGKSVVFRSNRNSYYDGADRLFTVSMKGGLPTELPLAMGEDGSLSPDGTHVAYVPHGKWQPAWKRYRGGQTTPIWIANLADSTLEKIPRENSNDSYPMWVGNIIYFLSDRNGPVSLFAYDTASKQVSEVLKNNGLDFKSASAGPDAIVIEQFGSLHLYDLATRQDKVLTINVAADIPAIRPQFVKVDPKKIHSYNISPGGARAVMEAWGEIFTVPSDKGDIRNLTNTPAIAERDPAWSPDGKWIAFFSDASGEYQLELRGQTGRGEIRHLSVGDPPSFYYGPNWSPDSKKIAYTDKRMNLWYVDLASGKNTLVASDYYDNPQRALNPAWAPDSAWLTYTKQLPSHLRAVFVYSLATGKSLQVTDGLSDAEYPAFDKSGKYLYFTSSTDVGLTTGWLDMSSLDHPVTRSVYLAVLGKDTASPLAPESDEEKIKEEIKQAAEDKAKEKEKGKGKDKDKKSADTKKDADKKDSNKDKDKDDKDKDKKDEPVVVTIDADGIGQRIVALPIPAKNYLALQAGKSGAIFLAEAPIVIRESDYDDLRTTIQKFDLTKRKLDKFLDDVSDFTISSSGEKMIYRKGEEFDIAATDEPPSPTPPPQPKPGEGPLKLDAMEVRIDPRPMWKQAYHETWRIQRDFLYDPNHQGLDLAKLEKKYQPYLDNLGSRSELSYLLEEALGEIQLGHVFVGDGYKPEVKATKTGLLGADYKLENGRYRITHVYDGENWNPDLQAPLTQPGVNVKAGDYILAVNGVELLADNEIFSLFEETAGKQVVLKVGPNPDGKNSREVTVVPVPSEIGLSRRAWIEGNRRKVDELSGGRLAYVYLPNTAGGGFTNFNRYYFAQIGKQGAVIDERFNEGGDLADYVIDYLRRPLMSMVTARDGQDFASPVGSIYGPKVMIINEMAGSGGDAMPWYFRKAGIGPLVGKNTWGGLVGIYDYPELIDGGHVTAPRAAIYGLKGEWEVEGHGIAPDYDVELDPALVRQGHDPQLEKAVAVALDLLQQHPLPKPVKPSYPNYHQNDGLGVGASK